MRLLEGLGLAGYSSRFLQIKIYQQDLRSLPAWSIGYICQLTRSCAFLLLGCQMSSTLHSIHVE